jgi:5-(carboxyamino)imidazole ribonucleotide synthase
VPATISDATAEGAIAAAFTILRALDYVGVIGVEFFVLPDGALVANEIAPRVHNSGHWTEAACAISQFEQHIRAICGLPLGGTALTAPRVEMRNLIGNDAASWREILADPATHLHLYGKQVPLAGRKMGHVTRLIAD